MPHWAPCRVPSCSDPWARSQVLSSVTRQAPLLPAHGGLGGTADLITGGTRDARDSCSSSPDLGEREIAVLRAQDAFDSRGDRSPCGQAARAFAEAVIRSVEFIVQPDAHSAATDINDAVSALRLVLQLEQVPCLPQ